MLLIGLAYILPSHYFDWIPIFSIYLGLRVLYSLQTGDGV